MGCAWLGKQSSCFAYPLSLTLEPPAHPRRGAILASSLAPLLCRAVICLKAIRPKHTCRTNQTLVVISFSVFSPSTVLSRLPLLLSAEFLRRKEQLWRFQVCLQVVLNVTQLMKEVFQFPKCKFVNVLVLFSS